MSSHEEDRIKQLLKQALRPVETGAEPERDVWPDVLRRLDRNEGAGAAIVQRSPWVWFDVALLAGLAVLGVSFPTVIPLLLYYL